MARTHTLKPDFFQKKALTACPCNSRKGGMEGPV